MSELHVAGAGDEPNEAPRPPLKSAQVLVWNGLTKHTLEVDRVIDRAKEAKLSACIVIGETEEGEFYFASNRADGGDVLWLLEKAKHMLLRIGGATP